MLAAGRGTIACAKEEARNNFPIWAPGHAVACIVAGPSPLSECGSYSDPVTKRLRVVVLADGETVHTAFFDRDFSGG
jgi:hypothetical protein